MGLRRQGQGLGQEASLQQQGQAAGSLAQEEAMNIRPNIFAQSIDLADLVDVEDVEIVQTGIEYQLASGPKTFTVDDLRDAVDSQGDPAIKRPRLKLGHVADLGLLDDGQPAIGTVAGMRLEQGGNT